MSKLSYQCCWKSISLNEQKNQTISTRHLLLTWIMGKQTCLLLREVSWPSKLQRKSSQNQITVCLLGRSLKPIPFSPKLKILDGSNTQVEYHDVFALGLGVQRERAELQARGKHRGCNPSWAQGSSCTASWLFQTHHFLWCNPRSCTTEERTSGRLWRLSHEAVPLQ